MLLDHSSLRIFDMGSTYTKDFKVAIVGGGVVGLTCAVGLRRAGIKVDVFESAVRMFVILSRQSADLSFSSINLGR